MNQGLNLLRPITEEREALRGEMAALSQDSIPKSNAVVWKAMVRESVAPDRVALAFTYVSPAAEEILGYPCQQWLTDPHFWESRIHPEDRGRGLDLLRRIAQSDENDHDFEYQALTADRRNVWLRERIHVMRDTHGRPWCLSGLALDITQRVLRERGFQEAIQGRPGFMNHDPIQDKSAQEVTAKSPDAHIATATHIPQQCCSPQQCCFLQDAHEELRRSHQTMMQQARLRALGEMASGIAHDIGNSLSPIMGYTDLLLCDEKNLSERALKFLRIIKTAASDIGQTVSHMKELYRKRDEHEPVYELKLNELAEEAIELTRPRWSDIPQEKGTTIEIGTDFQDDLAPISGTESEIREAITNLIFNAVDAMPEGGTITLRTRGTTSHLFLEVCDEGIGMDEGTRRHCLEPFFSTKGDNGTGLGLAMVFGTMQRHEGEVQIESQLGKGTCVRLLFPRREVKGEKQVKPACPASHKSRPSRILFIDDEALVRELMKEMTQRDGHATEVADSGKAGVEAFREAMQRGVPFDVVIADLGMPRMDGRKVAQLIKKDSPCTPVILLTGWASYLKLHDEIPNGVDMLLGKPLGMRQLREALAKVI